MFTVPIRFLTLVVLLTAIASSRARADDVHVDRFPSRVQLGVYATVGGILGSTDYDHHDADRYSLFGALAEVGMVFGRIDVGLRGGFALLTTEDAAATAELTAGVRFF